MQKVKGIAAYFLLFFAVALLGVLMLYLTGLLPQEIVHSNLALSAVQFEEEGEQPYVFNIWNDTYRLDAFSESLMINHAYFMDTAKHPLSIIENLTYRDGLHPVSSLLELAERPDAPGNSERARYWLGFRTYVRSLLCLIPYQDIRGVLSLVFFCLMFAAMFTLRDRAGTLPALALGATVLAMNPVVVSTSLQFSCCFLIAFVGICAVCRHHLNARYLYGLFMVIGQATMYFDFYTSPLVTWGLPLIALLAIHATQSRFSFREMSRLIVLSLLMWMAGYVGMWVLKMILNTLLTDQNGFEVIFHFLYYTGISDAPSSVREFTPLAALYACLKKVFTVQNRFILLVAMLGGALYFGFAGKQRKLHLQKMNLIHGGYFAIAMVPVVWILCSRQASGVHSYFQYRTLAVSVFAGLCFVSNFFIPVSQSSLPCQNQTTHFSSRK